MTKKIFLTIISVIFLTSCAKFQSYDTEGIDDEVTSICVVDSKVFNKPFIKQSTGKSYQTLPDKVSVAFTINSEGHESVLINKKNVFKRCRKKMEQIHDEAIIKNIFRVVQGFEPEDSNRFIDAWFTTCLTVDEIWYFIKNEEFGYVGYAGPEELPLSIVGMKCKIKK